MATNDLIQPGPAQGVSFQVGLGGFSPTDDS